LTLLLNILSRFFGSVPLPVALWIGRGIGRVAHVFSRRKREIRARIRESLDVDVAEARRIERGMYSNLGMTIAEFFRMERMSEEEMRSHVRFENLERLPLDCGTIAIITHTGNFELQAAASRLYISRPLNVVVKSLRPESLNNWITRVRTHWGVRIHDRKGSFRELLKVIKRGENLAYILDQNAKRNWGVFVDFFGKPACTSDGLAQMAALSGNPIFPVFCRRLPDHHLLVTVGEEVPGPKDRSPEEIHRVTAACTKTVEDFIRKHPDQWIWMHRRWRTKAETTEILDGSPD
jgi:KDO2-lipid IV(A) lauroyltransferase